MQTQTTVERPQPSIPARDGPIIGYLLPARRFVLQFMEMCAAMCAGGIVLDLAFFQGAALLGYPDFFQQNREVSILVLGINWGIAMGVWMAVRGHPWRHNLEMSSTSALAAVLLIAAYWWFGFVPKTSNLDWVGQFLFQCGPSCALMGADMLLHFRHYAGSAGHHAHMA